MSRFDLIIYIALFVFVLMCDGLLVYLFFDGTYERDPLGWLVIASFFLAATLTALYVLARLTNV